MVTCACLFPPSSLHRTTSFTQAGARYHGSGKCRKFSSMLLNVYTFLSRHDIHVQGNYSSCRASHNVCYFLVLIPRYARNT
jgi:hypothetical protein